jgi:hypothetical protein
MKVERTSRRLGFWMYVGAEVDNCYVLKYRVVVVYENLCSDSEGLINHQVTRLVQLCPPDHMKLRKYETSISRYSEEQRLNWSRRRSAPDIRSVASTPIQWTPYLCLDNILSQRYLTGTCTLVA